jgi:hypothetical protein
MPTVRIHAPSAAREHVTALLNGTAYRLVPAASDDAGAKPPTVLLLTAYQPSARERRPHAGIRKLTQWRREGEQAPALVCAFRSKQRLLRFPANALLREPGTTFLRLPCRRETVVSALEVACPLSASEREGVAHGACTAWGQLAGYADRLIEAAKEPPPEDKAHTPDLALLRAFARRRFGDWLDAPLAQAEVGRAQGDTDEMTRSLREAKQRAPEAAVYRTFGTLAHGRAADLSNKGLGPLRTMLLSMQQGLAGEKHLDKLLASRSWLDFKGALQKATNTLTLLDSSSAPLPDVLQEHTRDFLDQHDALVRLTETGAIREQPAAAVEAIDGIQEASRSILRRRADARERTA